MLHVAQISFFEDPQGRDPHELLEAWPSLVDVAEAAANQVRVSVVQASAVAGALVRAGVDYHFIASPAGNARVDTFAEWLLALKVDVVHVHGLGFPAEVCRLRHQLPDMPLLLQDHANQPPRIWRRALWRRGLAAADGIAFCAAEQAEPFARDHLIAGHAQIFEIPESSSRFTPGDPSVARSVTGLYGEPCVLWVGHLNENKDPLSVLDGISRAAAELPGLQLWCCFASAPLLDQVKAHVAHDSNLQSRVHLLGRVAHDHIEHLMRAADIFVSGSHREGSGYSLIEALACDLPPVVTDIASFRALTGGGIVGHLWPHCQGAALYDALLRVTRHARVRGEVRRYFDAELSMTALGRKLAAAYEHLSQARQQRTRHFS